MREGQKRINVYIPDNLYSHVLTKYDNITEAVINGLEKLLETHREDFESRAHTNTQGNSNSLNSELIKSLQNHITSLESQIMVKDEQLRTQAVHLQTVLTQKYIAPPARKERPAPKTEDMQEQAPEQETQKKKNQINCLICGELFTAERSTRKFCSNKCRQKHNRDMQK